MEQKRLFKIRDKRNKGWFWLDNDYLNGYARIFGAVGTAIYVSLCRHADNETQECFPSMELIARELNISRNTVSKYINLFVKSRLLECERKRDQRTKKYLNNIYYLSDKSEWMTHDQIVVMGSHAQPLRKPCTTDDESHAQPLGNKETHINYTHNNNTHTTAPSADSEEEVRKVDKASSVIYLFKSINPSYSIHFSRVPQRKSAERLYEREGIERIERVIEYINKHRGEKYFPTITTPCQLEERWAELENFARKQKKAETNFIM